MTHYRHLTEEEKTMLIQHGCSADDWRLLEVTNSFKAAMCRNVTFRGSNHIGCSMLRNATLHHVWVGDGCIVDNIGVHILNYRIDDCATVRNIGRMETTSDATFGAGTEIAMLNEGGKANVVLGEEMTYPDVFNHTTPTTASQSSTYGHIAANARVENTSLLYNARVREGCVIDGAQLVRNVTLNGTARIGAGCIVEDSIITSGSAVLNNSIVRRCYVGECSLVTDGFTATDCLVFVNSHLACGEAVACLCGPFTVSHHKSTLLIGGHFEMFNAGSGTNFSNHAYKMGPIHHGKLLRGCKTASNAHIIWPAQIGAFSMCMGNIYSHPDTRMLPFSYLIGDGNNGTRCIPGRHLTSCGLWRDIGKWEKRDQRPEEARHTPVDYNWLNSDIIAQVRQGLDILRQWQAQSATTQGKGFYVEMKDVEEGIRMYELILRLSNPETREHAVKEWTDAVIDDARKEYALGDVEQETLDNFVNSVMQWRDSQ